MVVNLSHTDMSHTDEDRRVGNRHGRVAMEEQASILRLESASMPL